MKILSLLKFNKLDTLTDVSKNVSKCRYLTFGRGIHYETQWEEWYSEAIAMFEE